VDAIIEQATLDDLESILEIEKVCFGVDSFTRKQFRYLITKAKGVFYVLKLKTRVVGYISLISNSYTRNLRIYSIAVHPDMRGYGFARQLLNTSLQYAFTNKFKAISLEVKTTNTPALSLYEKSGFIKTSLKPYYYQDGSDAYGMRLLIDRQCYD